MGFAIVRVTAGKVGQWSSLKRSRRRERWLHSLKTSAAPVDSRQAGADASPSAQGQAQRSCGAQGKGAKILKRDIPRFERDTTTIPGDK